MAVQDCGKGWRLFKLVEILWETIWWLHWERFRDIPTLGPVEFVEKNLTK